jgi:hypothetical protein
MTKTAYATRMTPEELAEETKDMSPEDREYRRVENATSPLFDMWLRFLDVFGDRAIDRLDVSDDDAEVMAKRMEGTPMGDAYAYLLRQISHRRCLRELFHKVCTLEAAGPLPEMMTIPEVHERYAKLPKGKA